MFYDKSSSWSCGKLCYPSGNALSPFGQLTHSFVLSPRECHRTKTKKQNLPFFIFSRKTTFRNRKDGSLRDLLAQNSLESYGQV
ncbi:MAG: hypothetical protein ACFB0B_21290 [Thermonemataceae bacterium]